MLYLENVAARPVQFSASAGSHIAAGRSPQVCSSAQRTIYIVSAMLNTARDGGSPRGTLRPPSILAPVWRAVNSRAHNWHREDGSAKELSLTL